MTCLQHVYFFLLYFISNIFVKSHLFDWKSIAVYSTHNTFVLGNLTVGLFERNGVSSMRCGLLCLEESCCKGFLFNRNTKRCVGLQFDNLNYTANFKPTFSDDGMIPYRKGCETGWLEFQGHCYYKGQTKLKWSEAKTECQKMCSYLVEIESKEEADWVNSTFLQDEKCASDIFLNCTAWIGLNDIDIEGTFIWDHSNASLTFTNWHPTEPSLQNPELAPTRDCVDILRGGVWNDRPCSHLNWVICEKSF